MKYYGVAGFVKNDEIAPGIHKDVVTERPIVGDLLTNESVYKNGNSSNESTYVDTLTCNNVISLLYDDFIIQNKKLLKYVTWMESKWKVDRIVFQPPRIQITLGGIYE